MQDAGRRATGRNGLKLNRFHTTALCSPTRQAMLTGRNHHSVGMGGITEMATSAPGNSSVRPKDKAPIAETLRLNGYATAQFGKCHEVPVWEVSPAGPFHQWPTGSGFEYFYGFIGGEANQYYPGSVRRNDGRRTTKVARGGLHAHRRSREPGDHLGAATEGADTGQAVLHVLRAWRHPCAASRPKQWSDKYKGKFDDGWDALRERLFAKQKKLGVVPKDAKLTQRHDEIPGWDDMPDDLKPVLARQMEIYAGFLEQTDHEVGRVSTRSTTRRPRRHAGLLHLRRQRRLRRGHAQRLLQRDDDAQRHAGHRDHGVPAVQDRRLRHPECVQPLCGWLGARPVYAVSVDQAGGVALGRTRNGTVVHWPNGIDGQGRDPQSVPPCHRRRADHPGSRRVARPGVGERNHPGAAGGGEHARHPA